MKASYFTLALLLLAGFSTGCDNISEDDRYYTEEKVPVNRNLLIMEFTGNSCMNCPTGAEEVEKIKLDYGADKVISVGLHPDGDKNSEPVPSIHTRPAGTLQDFRCAVATDLYKYYKPGGFPCAIFDGLESSMSSATGDWMTRAKEAFKLPSYVILNAECQYDESTRDLNVTYDVTFSDDLNKRLSVAVWVVENGILGTQTMPNGSKNFNYVHNHVLRGSLNGTWGEHIGDSFTRDSQIVKTASMTLPENWVANNCDVVVFAVQDDDKYVQQVISLPIGE